MGKLPAAIPVISPLTLSSFWCPLELTEQHERRSIRHVQHHLPARHYDAPPPPPPLLRVPSWAVAGRTGLPFWQQQW